MLYHRRAEPFIGESLYPLNQLQFGSPQLYAENKVKYEGRDDLLLRRLPHLNCLWNDVIHLSPVHPQKMQELSKSVGLTWTPSDWFEIDPITLRLDASNALIYRFSQRYARGAPIPEKEFVPFETSQVNLLGEIPQLTKDYYKDAASTKAPLLQFVGVPHILYLGTINVENVRTIRV